MALFFIKIKWGLCLYTIILFLVPTPPEGIRWSYINILLLLALIVYARTKKMFILNKDYVPFIYFYIVLLILCLFTDETPLNYQLGEWLGNVLRFVALPVAIYGVYNYDNKRFSYIIVVVFFCVMIASLYAIFLTQLDGINPYLMILMPDQMEEMAEWSRSDTRLFGRIFSVFWHPMTFGCFIVNSFFFCLYYILVHRGWTVISCIGLCLLSICAVICGVRSVIGGIFVGMLLFLLYNLRKIYLRRRYLLFGVLFLIVVTYYISQNQVLSAYIQSIFITSNKSQLEGSSSLSGRLSQLVAVFDILSDNPFFGKGFNWTSLYNQTYGPHPICRSFESYIYVVLCNSGLLGFISWILFLGKIYKRNIYYYKKKFDEYRILMCLSSAHIFYICITGDYTYTIYWLFFYLLIITDMKIKCKQV